MGSIGYVEKTGCSHKSPHKGMAAWAERKVPVLAPAQFENAMRPPFSFRARRQRLGARAISVPTPTRDCRCSTLSRPQALMAGDAWHAKPRRGGRAFLVELLAPRQANDRPAEAAGRIRMEQNPSKLMTRVRF